MADNFNNYSMKVQARVDLPSNKDIDAQIRKLEKSISKLKVSGQFDDTALRNLTNQLNTLKASITTANFSPTALTELTNQVNRALQNINIGNINVGNIGNQAQQVGQQIGNAISQGINQSTSNVSQATGQILRDFSELNEAKRKFVDGENGKGQFFSEKEIADANKFYQTIRDAFKEFGQVTISKGEMTDGNLENLRVKIQQVNGELKTTREFMLYLNESTKGSGSFRLVDDDTIKTTESMVQHLNEAKNITNATGDEANALKQKLAEQEKYYDKLEQASKEQLAIEKQRITAGEKQLEVLDKQSKRRDSRKSYNEGQINKKGLTDTERQKEINDLVYAGNEKYDSAFAKEIDKSLSNLSDLKSKWKEQGIYVDEFKTKVESLETSLNGIDSGDVKGLNAIKQKMEELKTEANQLVDVNKIQLSTDITKIENDYKRFGVVSQEVENNLKELKIARENALKAEGTDRASAEIEKYNQKLAETKSSWKELQATQVSMNQRTSQMTTMQEWMRKNQKATKLCGVEVEKLIQECQTCDKVRFDQIKSEFKELQVEAGKAGKLGNTLFGGIIEQGKKFLQWTGVTGAVMAVSNKAREAVTELKDLDDILTEITKTSDLTEQQLRQLGDSAYDTASAYGKKASDYLTGVQEMYRAGFDNAEQMAELSVLAQAAGDMELNSANDYIMATNAAYDFKANVEELNKVLDSQNYITNNAAVSMQDMADATSEAASISAQYGVEIDQLSAMIATVASKTRESGSEVGTALRSIFVTLQDTTSKPVVEAFNSVGISMTKFVDGTEQLKTPIELLKELSVAFNELPEGAIERSTILTDIGKKYHANTLSAILSDWESYEQMLELYSSSSADGSAFREAEKSANNLSGSLNKLSNTWTDTVDNILNSDTLTTGVNVLNDLLGLVNKLTESLGGLGTLGLGAGLFTGFKNVGGLEFRESHFEYA